MHIVFNFVGGPNTSFDFGTMLDVSQDIGRSQKQQHTAVSSTFCLRHRMLFLVVTLGPRLPNIARLTWTPFAHWAKWIDSILLELFLPFGLKWVKIDIDMLAPNLSEHHPWNGRGNWRPTCFHGNSTKERSAPAYGWRVLTYYGLEILPVDSNPSLFQWTSRCFKESFQTQLHLDYMNVTFFNKDPLRFLKTWKKTNHQKRYSNDQHMPHVISWKP